MKINPLTDEQREVANKLATGRGITRFMANGHAASINTGECDPKGINVIHQTHYWCCNTAFNKYVLKCLQDNNPDVLFRAIYSPEKGGEDDDTGTSSCPLPA
jgi:hypothetical protein